MDIPVRGQQKGPAKRPNCLICYLCGQGFGTSSLKIHMPQCYDKKMKQWPHRRPGNAGAQAERPVNG